MPQKTPEQVAALRLAKKLWTQRNKDVLNQRRRDRYPAHREKLAEQKKRSYQKHRATAQAKIRQWAQEHPEEVRAIKATYRETHRKELREKGRRYAKEKWASDPETARQLARAYTARNRERLNAKARQRLADNREVLNERQRQKRATNPEYDVAWRKAHPESHRASEKKRRARKLNAPINDFTATQWKIMKAHYHHRCVYCGRKMKRLTMDHMTPLSKGGSHTAANIVPACLGCNIKKATGSVLVPVQPMLL